jgi:hypothetical protein
VNRFRRVKAPTSQELTRLAHTIAYRVGRFPEGRVCGNGFRSPALVRDSNREDNMQICQDFLHF